MAKVTERLADLASGMMLTSALVSEVERLSPRFVRVGLRAAAFRTASWKPGTKLQLRPRRGTLGLRTYTPVEWDAEHGATRLIAFTHGEGPAAEWFRAVQVDAPCEVFGPRGSMDLRGLSDRVVFVGDESSVGLACALRTATATATATATTAPDVRHVFEAIDPAELATVLDELGLAATSTVLPRADDRTGLVAQARAAAVAPFDLVVSGDAATVHAVRRAARSWPHRPTTTRARAYWAEGRTGLD
jgi:NADPH-dependent ferric siderophore reductase